VVKVSLKGPGKPYCRMPVGFTGAPGREAGIEGIEPGTGDLGDVRDGNGRGVAGVALGIELSCFGRDEEYIRAVRAAPAPAEVAAMMARVVFDMFDRSVDQRRRYLTRLELNVCCSSRGHYIEKRQIMGERR
jgi:hypothetical protein